MVGEKATRRESNRQQHPRAFGQMIKDDKAQRTHTHTRGHTRRREKERKCQKATRRESKDSAIVPEHRIVESVCSGRVGSGRVGRRESN